MFGLTYQQVRKNKFVEILPINVGCLGACTYCKTKHARGHLGSYTVDGLVSMSDKYFLIHLCLILINKNIGTAGRTCKICDS